MIIMIRLETATGFYIWIYILYSLIFSTKDESLSSSTRPMKLSNCFPFLKPITDGTAVTPCSMASSPMSSMSTMARSTSPSVAATAASILELMVQMFEDESIKVEVEAA